MPREEIYRDDQQRILVESTAGGVWLIRVDEANGKTQSLRIPDAARRSVAFVLEGAC